MRNAAILLKTIATCALANQVAVNPVQVNQLWNWLRYDDGTYNWLIWDGKYRGVWFNVEDFLPVPISGYVSQVEVWFYHSTSYPWDTSDVFIEIWNGYPTYPSFRKDQVAITAIHASPSYATIDPVVKVWSDFWCIVNTEVSSGGWPSILGDNMNTDISHSYFSDDFIVWEPWLVDDACNYFIAAYWQDHMHGLRGSTWGGLKSLFQ